MTNKQKADAMQLITQLAGIMEEVKLDKPMQVGAITIENVPAFISRHVENMRFWMKHPANGCFQTSFIMLKILKTHIMGEIRLVKISNDTFVPKVGVRICYKCKKETTTQTMCIECRREYNRQYEAKKKDGTIEAI